MDITPFQELLLAGAGLLLAALAFLVALTRFRAAVTSRAVGPTGPADSSTSQPPPLAPRAPSGLRAEKFRPPPLDSN